MQVFVQNDLNRSLDNLDLASECLGIARHAYWQNDEKKSKAFGLFGIQQLQQAQLLRKEFLGHLWACRKEARAKISAELLPRFEKMMEDCRGIGFANSVKWLKEAIIPFLQKCLGKNPTAQAGISSQNRQ